MARSSFLDISPGPKAEREVLENPRRREGDAFWRHRGIIIETSHPSGVMKSGQTPSENKMRVDHVGIAACDHLGFNQAVIGIALSEVINAF